MSSLNFTTHGDPDRPAIMLLHGFISCNAQWAANIAALKGSHFLITVELWGHGDSPLPQNEASYTTAAYAEQFEAIRSTLGIERWALIGQSYGAGLVISYALAHPEVCTAVVATNSRSAFGTLTSERREPRRPQPTDLRKLPFHPIHARRFPPAIKAALVDAADRMDPEAVRLGGLLGANLNCIESLAALQQPLLITNGRYEKSFQTDLAALRGRYPDLQVVDLEGGHSVNIEAADGWDQAVLDFLRKHG